MDWDGQYDGLRESGAFFRPMRIPEQCSGEMLSAELQREFCFQPLDDALIQNTGSRLLKIPRCRRHLAFAFLRRYRTLSGAGSPGG